MYESVLTFWFEELEPATWWKKSAALDEQIRQRFGAVHRQASKNELYTWRENAESAVAEVIVLDQFSRNIHRDTPAAFASDALALALAQNAIARGYDKLLDENHRYFLYMPFMHSESAVIHEQAIALFEALGNDGALDFERKHKAIIDEYGRYPHRNAILGRPSTEAEEVFLSQPGSSF